MEQDIITKLEEIGNKSILLTERTVKDATPGFLNLLDAISSWLSRMLSR